MSSYASFLESKRRSVQPHGASVAASATHPMLHEWQAELTAWAVRVGRAAIWADTGLGKSFMQIEWARLSGDTALIVAPLAVCHQTVREAAKLGVEARYVRDGEIPGPGLWVTNYEQVPKFSPHVFDAVVLDEASILKNSDGKTRRMLIEHFARVPARLACTATPAPNEPEELCNQAEFLGHSTRTNMLAAYFVHDDQGWRLKGHAREPMFRWMSSWAAALRRPSDIGYPDGEYQLPGLRIIPELIPVEIEAEGQLFATDLGGVGGRAKVRRETLEARCNRAIELVEESHNWQRIGSKLAAWDGSLSTPQTAELSTRLTLPSESVAERKDADRRRTASTCASTTSATASASSSTDATPPHGGTPAGESGTQTTPNTGPSASDSPSSATAKPSATTDSEPPTGSQRPNTTSSSNSSKAAAPSAAAHSATSPDGDSSSTTATTRAECEGSSAAPATSASASSTTTRSCLVERSSTSSARPEPWIIWVDLNDEQEYLARAFGDRCISVTGSMSPEEKADLLLRWADGERPVLITKPKIAAFGMNFQHCARMAFVGLSDSYEAYYQAIRRCYRYGQTRIVHAHIVLSELEAQIAANVKRKEQEAAALTDQLVTAMRIHGNWRTAA